MSLIAWDKKYAVGSEQLDGEHQYLFQLINDFHDAFSEKQERARLLAVLNRLVAYAQQHFTNEEGLMRDAGYPQYEAHRVAHERLFEEIFALNAKFENRAINPTHDTFQFLRGWLADHILQEDMAFAAHLREAMFTKAPVSLD